MNPELAHLRLLTVRLQQNLALCAEPEFRIDAGNSAKARTAKAVKAGRPGYAQDRKAEARKAEARKVEPHKAEPSVDAVHDIRTGTRRIEAILDAMLAAAASSEAMRLRSASADANGSESEAAARDKLVDAIERWQRLLKKIRRSAGSVRDLDVHRQVLAGLLKDIDHSPSPGGHSWETQSSASTRDSGENATTVPRSPLHAQADDLDAWLRHSRHDASQPLMRGAKKWDGKLDERLADLTAALAEPGGVLRKPLSAAATALDAFARLSGEMEQLYADNLHDFRKGAKKARYMAEMASKDEHAGAVGKALKKMQDEIGDWHDWLMLSEEAHRALGESGPELTAHIEHQREQHYLRALKTAERMRGRLMGEWRVSTAPVRARVQRA